MLPLRTFIVITAIVQVILGQAVPKSYDDPILEIPQGKLVGHWKTSLKGRKFAAFEGIPFAKPPVGDRRFREPEQPEPWHGVLQAKNLSRYCLQWYHLPDDEYHSVIGDEDCLYLNVYTPKIVGKLPVVVYIHGGAFIFGTGVTYEPTYLMDKDMIYININYRLGPLGFLSTQDKIVPGNNGMKDQVMALKWIKNNIHLFGGDKDDVTIMGMSAGGASVHYHMLSPLSIGLFTKGISQSGTTCCPWTLQTRALEKALFIGNHLGCPTTSTKQMIKCLKTRPAASIVATVNLFMPFLHSPFSPFAPVVEPKDTKGGFLTEHPHDIIVNGGAQDVAWLNSLTTHEGIYPAGIFASNHAFVKEISTKWTELVPYLYDFNDTLAVSKHELAAEKIKKFYFGNKDISMETFDKLIDSLSDRHFVVAVEECLRLMSTINKKPIYLYQFAYSGADSLGKALSLSDENYGVSHGDDTGYSIDTEYMDPTTTDDDRKMIDIMTHMIYSFAKTGKPEVGSVEWKTVNENVEGITFLRINGPNDQEMKTVKNIGPTDFWNSFGFAENENVKKCKRDEL